jgi:hypothetical protein
MRTFVLALVLFGAGWGVGWLFATTHAQRTASVHGAGAGAQADDTQVEGNSSARVERAASRDSGQSVLADAVDPPTHAPSVVPAESFGTTGHQVGIGQFVDTGTVEVDAKTALPWERPSVEPERLLDAASITCEFGAGLTGSARSLPNIGFQYQGSPIGFDTFDMAEGTARMTGNIAGSTYEAKVRFDATPGALHFSGVLPSGNFVLVTVFGLVTNDLGDYAAIMTMHNQKPTGLHTQINSGGCH